jgi:hypothetical protein
VPALDLARYFFTILRLATPAAGMTCGELKDHYKTEECCGSPDSRLILDPKYVVEAQYVMPLV